MHRVSLHRHPARSIGRGPISGLASSVSFIPAKTNFLLPPCRWKKTASNTHLEKAAESSRLTCVARPPSAGKGPFSAGQGRAPELLGANSEQECGRLAGCLSRQGGCDFLVASTQSRSKIHLPCLQKGEKSHRWNLSCLTRKRKSPSAKGNQ